MGDALRGLDRKSKTFRDLFLPVFDHRSLRQAIEGVVDFHRGQTARVVREHLFRRQILRIEVSLPLFVTVAAGADVEVHDSTYGNNMLTNRSVLWFIGDVSNGGFGP